MAIESIQSEVTKLLRIQHPVLLAGMGNVATGKLVAAVSNAGGLGVLGGVGYTPKTLRQELEELTAMLDDKTAFGVDLLLPQVGGNARKTNSDYTGGKLAELIDIMIEFKARLFVCAVGVPPKWAVDKLHAAGILVMNMVGHPHHVDKALAVGVDLICAQGGEGGGHTGEVATMILIPQCIARCKGKVSPLHGGPVHVLAAGGITNGETLAAALSLGAKAVWVGTRFVASEESAAPKFHKKAVIDATVTDTLRTTIFSGRPMRVYKTDYVKAWETDRAQENHELRSKGIVPYVQDVRNAKKNIKGHPTAVGSNGQFSVVKTRGLLMGQGAGAISDIKPAKQIINEMVQDAVNVLRDRVTMIAKL